jgi:hypothetical protein
MNLNYIDVYLICYEGENETPPPGKEGEKQPDDKKPIFTPEQQEQVNKIVASERRKLEAQVDKQVKELESLKKSKTMSDTDRHTLNTQIEELKASVMTKEQLALQEKDKLTKESKERETKLTAERDHFKNLFEGSTITRSLLDGAVSGDAFEPSQIVTLLEGKTRLAEVTDGDGNPTGEFITKVKLNDKDKEGKPVTLDLTVEEAVKWMKDKPNFANLFKSNLTGGLGAARTTGGKKIDPKNMTPTQYREYRDERDGRKRTK